MQLSRSPAFTLVTWTADDSDVTSRPEQLSSGQERQTVSSDANKL